MKKYFQNLAKEISLEVFLLFFLFVVCLVVFSWIADEIVLDHNNSFDNHVIAFLAAHSNRQLVSIMTVISFFGSSSFLLPAYIIIVFAFLLKKKYRYAAAIAIIGSSSTAAMFLLKELFKRNRPDSPVLKSAVGYGFPSGHTLSAFIFCSIAGWLLWQSSFTRPWKYSITILLFVFALAIGCSRVVLNVHYASDVIAGFCFGIIWVLLSFRVMRTISRRSQNG